MKACKIQAGVWRDGVIILLESPIASLINVTERRAWIVNVASQKMLPKSGNLFEFHLHDIV